MSPVRLDDLNDFWIFFIYLFLNFFPAELILDKDATFSNRCQAGQCTKQAWDLLLQPHVDPEMYFPPQIEPTCPATCACVLRQGCPRWGHTSLMTILLFWWTVLLLTMPTMATPRLHRIPKEMQKPRPLRMAMM